MDNIFGVPKVDFPIELVATSSYCNIYNSPPMMLVFSPLSFMMNSVSFAFVVCCRSSILILLGGISNAKRHDNSVTRRGRHDPEIESC